MKHIEIDYIVGCLKDAEEIYLSVLDDEDDGELHDIYPSGVAKLSTRDKKHIIELLTTAKEHLRQLLEGMNGSKTL